jgi:nitronate monooxygenase
MSLPQNIRDSLALPLVAAPMFIISTPDLVIAQCKAGIIGSFPALNARPEAELEVWLERITSELEAYNKENPDRPAAPFAVNQIVHGSNNRLQHDLEMCVKYKVPIVITSLGAKEFVNEAVHSYGGVVFHDIISDRFARKAVEKGADGLIAVAAGAGGHAGLVSPFALIQEIREWFDGPLLLSGSIATGDGILAAQAMGADLAYIGSAFIATEEANAEQPYKQAIVDYASSDIVNSSLFTGVHGNYLKPSIEAAGMDPDNLPEGDVSTMNFGSGGDTDAKAWKDIWGCGQGIGAVKAVLPTAELVARLEHEYKAAKARVLAA